MYTINTTKPYKIFAEVLEEGALKQFEDAMNHPSVVKGALMPDAHTGYSLPIGGVVASKERSFPAFVGYDIGCGMCAVKLDLTKDEIDLNQLFEDIYANVPVGRNQHDLKQEVPEPTSDLIKKGLERKGYYQLGTLGSGNHFLEVGKGRDGNLWIIVHSGSRNLGHFIAEFYMKKAAEASVDVTEIEADFEKRNASFKTHNPEGFEKAKADYVSKQAAKAMKASNLEGLHSFDVNSELGKAYINDMNYCLEYALLNRKKMIEKVVELLGNPTELDFINRNHNHADFKDGLWIHRKGATHAETGMKGVIPGNMRDGCFIVEGLGSDDSLYSSSHGAGRVLSRKAATAKLKIEDFKETMTRANVIAKVEESTLDESPDAYKNIFDVMDAQKDLVNIVDHVKPLVNIKG